MAIYRMRLTGIATAATVVGGLVIAGATPSFAGPVPRGTCGGIYNPATSAGKAHWELDCKDGKITVSGWVQDTNADGRYAKVKAIFEGQITEYSAAACPKNNKKYFSWAHPGSLVDVYLYSYAT
ncbi:MAG: hypothetical protein ABIS86_05085 [Streptosporangiaceae bacterium]